MEQNLQAVIELVNANIHLSEEEKAVVLARLKEVDKKITITEFKLDRTEKVKKTTAILLEETIQELEQKRKAVEKQNRELEIEASLERVRAVAMGMMKPGDLMDICRSLYNECHLLGIGEVRNAIIHTYNEGDYFIDYDYSDFTRGHISRIPYSGNPILDKFVQDIRKTSDAFTEMIITGDDLKEWKAFRDANNEAPDERLATASSLYYYIYAIGEASIGISTFNPISADKLEVLKRFRNVFDLAYKRYVDITNAEAQAREAKIEAALEKVRSRTMAMYHSNELSETASVTFRQIKDLGFEIWSCGFCIWKDNDIVEAWMGAGAGGTLSPLLIPYKDERTHRDIYEASLKNKAAHEAVWDGKLLEEHFAFLETIPSAKLALNQLRQAGLSLPVSEYYYVGFFKHGYLLLITTEPDKKALDVSKRFAAVFDLTYTRFLDLQKAEAQAREGQVQLALERVRARTMAMQKSDELAEISVELVKQVQSLGIPTWHCAFNIFDEGHNSSTEWASNAEGTFAKYKTPRQRFFLKYYEIGQTGALLHVETIGEDRCGAHYEYLCSLPGLGEHLLDLKNKGFSFPTSQIDNVAYFQYGYLLFISYQPVPEAHDIFKRFAKVFEQTYTRFLDLQKAEAQAREAQVEAVLERVRARTMAMQRSNELADAAQLLFNQVNELGVHLWTSGFQLWDEGKQAVTVWTSTKGGLLPPFTLPATEDPFMLRLANAEQRGETFYVEEMGGDALARHYTYVYSLPSVVRLLETANVEGLEAPPTFQVNHVVFFSHGYILFITYQPVPEAHDIFKRFAKVFEQTYTRFLDLQKAEAQAREAQLEAALERVRSIAMGMMRSDDLLNICEAVFVQLALLGFNDMRAAQIYIRNDEEEEFINYDYADGTGADVVHVKYNSHPNTKRIYEVIKTAGDALVDNVIHKQELQEWKDYLYNTLGQPPEEKLDSATELHYYLYSFGNGAFGISNFASLTNEDLEILKRFRNVFSFSYQRYNDISLAEEQAREAKIEAALERVRSRTLAMQKSSELAETAVVLFKQLIGLGIAPNRLYIGIVHDETGNIEFWITDEDGSKVSTMFTGNAYNNSAIKKMYDGWKLQNKAVVIDMQGQELADYFHYLGEELRVPFKEGLSQKRRLQHIAYFSKGFIGIASPDEQPQETVELLERFAYVFNLTFTRFNDLKLAEAHAIQAAEDLIKLQTEKKRAEDALVELRAAQKQLVQSEKMASLGELTAGIAHEIQNPLNFVNNFSEVSNELIEEILSEMAKLKTERDELLTEELLNDIKQNLEKINHHGKRADAIVKGMLQHSRASSSQKELTDINALCDEYLRLCYHGLRAKDKTFNATIKTDFDTTLEKINILPQDVGRVILNILTNAFYAVNEKKKSLPEGYQPTVSVSTGGVVNKVEIKVTDNGKGIPQNIVDKIFQPFFTTKPTGQGTGLGLSLSYDIIKAHGGEIKVETAAGEGTVFIVTLPL